MKDGTFIATHSVNLCCSGFENDTDLKREFLSPRFIGLLGLPFNTVDGIHLAQKLDAQPWHLSSEASVLGFLSPSEEYGFALALRHPGFIVANKHGKRFVNQTKLESHRDHSNTTQIDPETVKYKHESMCLIFDEDNIQ